MTEQSLIVRSSETTLKGRNRAMFERQLLRNVSRHLASHGDFHIARGNARLIVTGSGNLDAAVDILRGLPGVANVSRAHHVPREPDSLTASVLSMVDAWRARDVRPRLDARTFRIEVERKDKRYPIHSMDLAALLGKAVLEHLPELRVNLTHPDFTVMVEVWPREALLFPEKISGPGGLAVGSSAKALCLLSAGIDSPVAAYQLMTRGCPIVYLNFHSFPFIGEQSKEKVHDMVRYLARFQPESRLIVAPFAQIQEQIRDKCPEALRTVLYRRMMNRVANRIAEREEALALVTGESLGQVASQTMENIRAIQETAELPVLQPLIGLSKQDIVNRAKQIGTFPISIQPFPDCCTLFQPRFPETRAKLEHLHRAERALAIGELVGACLAGIEVTDYGPQYYPADW